MSQDPNACGACAGTGAETPAAKLNRPGQTALRYRVGTQPEFMASLLARLSGADFPALAPLTARTTDDPAIALCDAAATMADVISFYQERIANEAYLRTATERRSLLELASLVGYQPAPGVAASSWLAFEMDQPLTADAPPVLPLLLTAGSRVQSVPGADEAPQTFETVEAITARTQWNAIRAQLCETQSIVSDLEDLYLKGTATQLTPGDAILIVGKERLDDDTSERWDLRVLTQVEADAPADRTRVRFTHGLGSNWPQVAPAAEQVQVYALRLRAALFGHNAPRPLKPDGTLMADPVPAALGADTVLIDLDNAYPKLLPQSWLVLAAPQADKPEVIYCELYRSGKLSTLSRADYGISGRITRVEIAGENIDKFGIRRAQVLAQAEALELAQRPLSAPVQGSLVTLAGVYPELRPGQALAFSGVDAQGAAVAEIALIDEAGDAISHAAGATTVRLDAPLKQIYVRASLRINANVARATHGESVSEIAGSGRAAQSDQRFTLRQFPLTYVSSSRPQGCESTLEVRVNDLRWNEVSSLFEQPADARVYRLARDDDGRSLLQFGDGVEGARLPTGQDNVRLRYRKGIGAAGNVRAGSLSTLLSRPLGLKAVLNPLAASGGSDAESRDDIRDNAPVSVLTLGRAVSVRDYADFARSYAGIGKSHALWVPYGPARGMHLTVAGPGGADISEDSGRLGDLLRALRAAGDPLLPLTVQSYRRAEFHLKAKIRVAPDALAEKVLAAVRAALRARFSFAAREFGQPVGLSEVIACMQACAGVVAVDVDELRRSDQPLTAQPPSRLPAYLPQPDAGGAVLAAELLLPDADSPVLGEMP